MRDGGKESVREGERREGGRGRERKRREELARKSLGISLGFRV